MKRLIGSFIVLGLALGITGVATAATGVEKQTAIDDALAWLATVQQADGRWDYSGGGAAEDTAATAAALLAFIEEKQRPAGWLVDYTTEVEKGMTFMLNQAQVVAISPQTAGDPDSDGNGIGVKFVLGGNNTRDTYVTGLAIPAIAKYIAVFGKANDLVPSGPLAGRTDGSGVGGAWTYKDAVVNTIDYFAFGQNDSGSARGGWRYYANYGDSDNSTAQWPVIAMLFATEPGVNAPAFVKNELAYWNEYIQNTVSGGSGYDSPTYLVNEAKTGGLLVEMVFAEDDTVGTPYNLSNADLLAALGYINTNWQTTASSWDGNFGQPYAMWSIYKGLELTVDTNDTTYITNLRDQTTARSGGPAPLDAGVAWTWWEDYCEYLYGTQNVDGSWTGYSSWNGPLATAWHVNILQGIRIPEAPDCAILGDQSVRMLNGDAITAAPSNVCSNDVLLAGGGVSVDSSLLALGEMTIRSDTAIQQDVKTNSDLRSGADITVNGDCKLGGTLYGPLGCDAEDPALEPFAMPACAVTPPADGSPDIVEPPGCTTTLSPGDYGKVVFGAACDVTLEAGEYHFEWLRFGTKTVVHILGPIQMHVVDGLRFDTSVIQTLENGTQPNQIVYLVQGSLGAQADADTEVYGTFCGPTSSIILRDGTQLTGGLIGQRIILGADVRFTGDPAPVQ